ncbi:MAG: hypothetical protein L0Y57_02615 [Beijerinckiaceae bacterium]|nr:hypothetical protein [Beijerinckiaceae bacterium]
MKRGLFLRWSRPAVDSQISQELDISTVVQQLTRLSDSIEKEYTLVNDRMTWLVVSEAFIFGAFATAAAGYPSGSEITILVNWLLFLMPVLGLLMAAFVIPAIYAAHSAAARLKNGREAYENLLPERLRVASISANDWEHHWGNIPPLWVPLLIIAAWAALLIVTLLVLCSKIAEYC